MTATITQEKTATKPERTNVAKSKKATVVSETIENVSETFNLIRAVEDFGKQKNAALKRMRVNELSLSILLLWIGRHIVRDGWKNSEWFGGHQNGPDYVFWFKLESDRNKAILFLDEIAINGIPKPRIY